MAFVDEAPPRPTSTIICSVRALSSSSSHTRGRCIPMMIPSARKWPHERGRTISGALFGMGCRSPCGGENGSQFDMALAGFATKRCDERRTTNERRAKLSLLLSVTFERVRGNSIASQYRSCECVHCIITSYSRTQEVYFWWQHGQGSHNGLYTFYTS